MTVRRGLLLLLGLSSNVSSDKIAWLQPRLGLAPLERIALVFSEYRDSGFRRIASSYEVFMAAMSDPETRQHLIAVSPREISDLGQPFDPVYARLHVLTAAIAEELTRFVLDRRDDWHPRFFQYYLL